MTTSAIAAERKIEERYLDLLAEGLTPSEVADALVDADVAAGEYEGCSTDLELAHADYRRQAETLLKAVGG